jgi:hypothetical protein
MRHDDPRARRGRDAPSRAARLFTFALAALALALQGCEGDPLPLTIATSNDPAPVGARLSTGFDNGVPECGNDETELDLYASYPRGGFGLFGVLVTRCTRSDGSDRLLPGVEYDLTQNLTIAGCPGPFLNNRDYGAAGAWIITEARCFDGQNVSFRIVAGEMTTGGNVVWETVFEQGEQLDDGLEYVDPRFIIPFISAGFDGVQPFFAMGIKVRTPGSTGDPQIGIGLCRRNGPGDWNCRAEYLVGSGDLSVYLDLGAVRVDVDCPPKSLPGSADCPAPATPTLAMMFRDDFDPAAFPPPDITALAEGSFDAATLRFIARKDDAVPGFSPRIYASFGEGFGLGRGGGAFAATDDQGNDYALRWQFQVTDEIVIAVEGDPVEGTNSRIDQLFNFSYYDGRAVFSNFEESTGAEQILYESGRAGNMSRIRSLFRKHIDVVANKTITDVDISSRGFDQRVILSGVAHSVSDRLILAVPIDSFELLDEGATSLYGSYAIGGVLNVISRERRSVDESFDIGSLDAQSLALTANGVLLAGSGEPTLSPLYRINRITHQPELIANTSLGGIVGLAATKTRVYATNGSELHSIDPDTGDTGFIGSFLDAMGASVEDVSGMSGLPNSERIVAVSESGFVWEVDPVTARLDLRNSLSLPGGPLRSIAATTTSDVVVGAEDGRAFQLGLALAFGGGAGAGSAPADVLLQTILDTGDAPLAGLAVEAVPEPGPLGLALSALLGVAALRQRR